MTNEYEKYCGDEDDYDDDEDYDIHDDYENDEY